MNEKMKKGIAAAAALWLVLGSAGAGGAAAAVKPAAAQTGIIAAESIAAKLVVDGKLLKLEQGQYVLMEGGRVYLPLRAAAAALSSTVAWEAKARTVSLWSPKDLQRSAAGSSGAGGQALAPSAPAGKKISLSDAKASFFADGQAVPLPKGQKAYLTGGSIYVPLRFLAELAGASVQWTAAGQVINISFPVPGSGGGEESGLSGPGESSSGLPGSASPAPGAGGGIPETPAPASPAPGGGIFPIIPPVVVPPLPGQPTPTPAPGQPTPAPGQPTPTPAPGQPTPAPGQPTPTPVPGQTQRAIQKAAEDKLNALLIQCQDQLMDVAFRYVQAGSQEEKAKLRARGEAVLGDCDRSFESVMVDTKAKLEAGGYPTAVLSDYRSMYEEKKASGKEMLDQIILVP